MPARPCIHTPYSYTYVQSDIQIKADGQTFKQRAYCTYRVYAFGNPRHRDRLLAVQRLISVTSHIVILSYYHYHAVYFIVNLSTHPSTPVSELVGGLFSGLHNPLSKREMKV
jgi:hypothetical protein